MRCTIASSLAVTGILLLSVSEGLGAPPTVLQEAGNQTAQVPAGVPSVEQKAIAALDEKLTRVVEANFRGVPLEDAILALSQQINVDLLLDVKAIEEEGIDLKSEIDLVFEHAEVTARTALDFLLEGKDLVFVNRSGVLFVTTSEAADRYLTLKVYNVRDLIEAAAPQYIGTEVEMPAGMGLFSVRDQVASGLLAGHVAQSGPVGQGGLGALGGEPAKGAPGGEMKGMSGAMGAVPWTVPTSPTQRAMDELMSVIQLSTPGPWLDFDGVGGTLEDFDGLLIIRNTEQAHNEIQRILEGLREAGRTGPGSDVTVPNQEGAVEEVDRSAPVVEDAPEPAGSGEVQDAAPSTAR